MHLMFFYRDLQNGGVQKNMLRLAEGLAQRGHMVDFLIAHSGANEFPVPVGVRLHRSGTQNPAGLVIALAREIDRLRPEVIYTAMPNYNAVALLGRVLARHKPKIIISERSHVGLERARAGWGLYRLSLLLAPWLYRLADEITAVSHETADSLAKACGIARGAITVLHNPVVGPAIATAAAAPLEHPWIAPPFDMVLAVGRLVPQKDYPTLLRGFARLKAKRPQVRLVILGDGPERTALAAQARTLGLAEAVEFAGFEANPYRWMARAKIFVLTSLWEGLPTVVIEALACGATMVATDSPSGPRQIIGSDGRLGHLVPMGDDDALAVAMGEALDAPLDRGRLRQEAEAYSIDAALARFEALLGALGDRK